MASQPPLRSPDGQWFWDGSQWRSLLSTDGSKIWNGKAWDPVPPGFTVSSPPAPPTGMTAAPPPPPPPAPPPPPTAEPRPAWLPADQPWPPPVHTASAPMAPPPPAAPIDWTARREAAFGPMTYSGARYAGFWIRFVAVFIDGIIISIPSFVVAFAIGLNAGLANPNDATQATNAATAPVEGLGLVLGFLYFSYFWSTGSTLGMRIFNLQVVDAGSQAPGIGFGRAALRYLGYIVSTFCCYVGLIWAAFDSRKQGWHDKIANTVVVYR